MFAVERHEGGYVRPEVAGRYGPVLRQKSPIGIAKLENIALLERLLRLTSRLDIGTHKTRVRANGAVASDEA